MRAAVFILLFAFYIIKHLIRKWCEWPLKNFAEIKDYSILINCGPYKIPQSEMNEEISPGALY